MTVGLASSCRPGPDLMVEWAVGDWHPLWVVLGRACRGLAGGFLLLWIFSVAISVSPHVCFVLDFDLYVSKIMHLSAGNLPCKPNNKVSKELGRSWGRGLVDRGLVEAPRWFRCWPSQGGSSVLVLWWFWMWRVVCGCSSLYINIKVGESSC